MLYKLFNGPAHTYGHNDEVPDLKYNGQAVIAIDPSKTNCAVVVGDPGGEVLSIVEMSGNNWSAGPVMDTTQYCSEVKEFLRRYIKNAEVYKIGLEQAITKKGMEHHHSNMVLTEIRGALLNLFWEEYGLDRKSVEVNNWAWKKAILPEGYRSQSEKGSERYFYQYLQDKTYMNYYEADVTDCLCIYKYLIKDTQHTYKIACQQAEEKHTPYQLALMPDWADALEYRKFEYNPSFSPVDNATYFANRSHKSGITAVGLDRITLDDIYASASGFQDIPTHERIRMVVQV